MTKVYISTPLPVANAEVSDTTCQANGTETVDEVLHKYSEPYRFVSFENNGIDLKAYGKCASDNSKIGIVSNKVGTVETGNYVTITLAEPVKNLGVVSFDFAEPVRANYQYGYITKKITYYSGPDRATATSETENEYIPVFYANLLNNFTVTPEPPDSTHIYVGEIKIEFEDLHCETANSFIRISNIYRGAIGTQEMKAIGNPEIHGAITPTLDDIQIVTADLSVETDTAVTNGAEVIIESDYFRQGFTIDSLERLAEKIYSLKCSDQFNLATNWAVWNSTENGFGNLTTSSGADNLTEGCPLVFEDDYEYTPNQYDFLNGFLPSGRVTCRQALAMYQAQCGKSLTTWGNSKIYHKDWASPILNGTSPSIVRTLTAHDLLDRAKYNLTEKFGSIASAIDTKVRWLNYIANITWQVEVSASNSEDSRSAYDWSKITIFEGNDITTDTPEETMKKIAKIINANEIEATIDYKGEGLGDWVSIVTPYNGTKTGYITEINLTLGAVSAVANIKVRVVE